MLSTSFLTVRASWAERCAASDTRNDSFADNSRFVADRSTACCAASPASPFHVENTDRFRRASAVSPLVRARCAAASETSSICSGSQR